MAADPFERVREPLALACNSLMVASERTGALLNRVKTLDQDLEHGDPVTALYGLPAIIVDLGQLTEIRPAVVSGTTKLTQEPVKVLVPGVADAIEKLQNALGLLRAYWSEGADE